ncbi:MAG TPA: hypothetical protein VFB45_19145 [Pseudolabrys sp.]|nr:hypothetical protein [Pseudolabrys sp.]
MSAQPRGFSFDLHQKGRWAIATYPAAEGIVMHADPQLALAYRELARTCLRQAAGTLNARTADTLRAMAHEYIAKARQIDPSLPEIAVD